MAKKYDLIVVGGGPGGLMAAKTAAEDGLKVALVERKKDITEIMRSCSYIVYFSEHGYNKVKVEIGTDKTSFVFPELGLSVDYDGPPLIPYYNFIWVSPSGYQVYQEKDRLWGFYYQKEAFLAGLLASAEKAGAEVLAGTLVLGAENTPDGVKVRVRGKSGEQTLEASAAIAADGINSKVVDSLGLNKKRQALSSRLYGAAYEIEGVECNLPDAEGSYRHFSIPSIRTCSMHNMGKGRDQLVTMKAGDPIMPIERFMKLPLYAPWFRHARVVKKTAYNMILRAPIKEPVAGNVVVVGDAGAYMATLIQGAVPGGYLAAKAILKELNGQKGYPEYIDWWQKNFFAAPEQLARMTVTHMPLDMLCSDEEVDYIHNLFRDKIGEPGQLLAENWGLIEERRPELYQRLKKDIERLQTNPPQFWLELPD